MNRESEETATRSNYQENDRKKSGPEMNISERQFYCYRFADRTKDKHSFHWLWWAKKLAEYFVISVLNRVERREMDMNKSFQMKKNYRKILARDYIDAIEKGVLRQNPDAKLGQIFFAPKSWQGSRAYYQQKYADLMTIVRKTRNPTWYVFFILLIIYLI